MLGILRIAYELLVDDQAQVRRPAQARQARAPELQGTVALFVALGGGW